MSNINMNLLLQNFFNKHPDIRGARNKRLINRRALAKFIIKNKKLETGNLDALLTALRRFPEEKPDNSEFDFDKDTKLSTKDKIAIVYLEKSPEVFKSIPKLGQLINFNKNDTLKIVLGNSSVKIFVDENNLEKVKGLFSNNDILKVYKDISELTVLVSEKARMTKGNLAYITSEIATNNLNIIELLTGRPELIFYFEGKDLLKAYETINRLRE